MNIFAKHVFCITSKRDNLNLDVRPLDVLPTI